MPGVGAEGRPAAFAAGRAHANLRPAAALVSTRRSRGAPAGDASPRAGHCTSNVGGSRPPEASVLPPQARLLRRGAQPSDAPIPAPHRSGVFSPPGARPRRAQAWAGWGAGGRDLQLRDRS